MKRRSKNKSPIIRLVLVVLLAVILFGAGFYAYYKRDTARGMAFNDRVDRVTDWFEQRKKQLHDGLKASKKVVRDDDKPEEQVTFEFYNSLADMQVKVDETPDPAKPAPVASATITNADELENELNEQMKVKNKLTNVISAKAGNQ